MTLTARKNGQKTHLNSFGHQSSRVKICRFQNIPFVFAYAKQNIYKHSQIRDQNQLRGGLCKQKPADICTWLKFLASATATEPFPQPCAVVGTQLLIIRQLDLLKDPPSGSCSPRNYPSARTFTYARDS